MPQQPISESLRSALQGGAEIGLARTLAGSPHAESISHFYDSRLSNLSESERNYVTGLSNSMLSAASYVAGLSPADNINPDNIPTNADLFGGDWEGKRLFWFGEWNIPGTDEWFKFSGTLPDVTTYSDIVSYAAQLSSSYIEAYPTKFTGPEGEVPEDINVRILGVEKAF